mmetsp:Transcript_149833/g.480135  ORF Transcript_149833/g.480135 Transcript_149833/m.480135 type:complete len:688 (-) Transcript_149833:91-2154(-)
MSLPAFLVCFSIMFYFVSVVASDSCASTLALEAEEPSAVPESHASSAARAAGLQDCILSAAASEAGMTMLTFVVVFAAGTLLRRAAPDSAIISQRSRTAVGTAAFDRYSAKGKDCEATPSSPVAPRALLHASRFSPTDGAANEDVVAATANRRTSASCRRPATAEARASSSEADALAAAVRAGRAKDLPKLLDAAFERAFGDSDFDLLGGDELVAGRAMCARLLLSSLRACATWRCFREALSAYDHTKRRLGSGSTAVWSLLLYSAVEAGQFGRCEVFFEKLCALGRPSSNDFSNMVRYHALRRDQDGLRRTLARLVQLGSEVDVLSRNRAMAACCNAGAPDLAEVLLASQAICPAGADAVAFNTLMKGHAHAGRPARCFELHEEMLARDILPTEMTFGILLNTCNGAGEQSRAKQVFKDLCASGLQLNTVHYTTYMKGLVSTGIIDDAAAVLGQMLETPGASPDLVTYSMLVKAYADRGDVTAAMGMLEQLVRQGIRADAVVLNMVLGACYAKATPPAQVFEVLERLLAYGLKPSSVTLSILVKAFVKAEAFDDALALLAAPGAEQRHRRFLGASGAPEARLFAQLAQAAARAGRGAMALAAYAAMVEAACSDTPLCSSAPPQQLVAEAASARLLQICGAAGQADAARALHKAVVEANRSKEVTMARRQLRAAAQEAAASAAGARQ